MFLGKEALNAKEVSVFGMPKMKSFLEKNGPWNQLVMNKNILIKEMISEEEVILSANLKVIPFLVPHRDEYSETVGYKIIGANKKALFIPDIDKWQKWERDIIKEIAKVDYAFLDATFFDAAEVNNRDISEIPHPFIIESMELFSKLTSEEKN
jgi:pyrroloquinoline quinone biosynthesis protein B